MARSYRMERPSGDDGTKLPPHVERSRKARRKDARNLSKRVRRANSAQWKANRNA